MSISSGVFTGSWYDWPSPLPSRARNSWNAFWTKPVRKTITDQIAIDTAATIVRRCRSASVLIGIDPARNSMPNAPPIAAITASLTPSDFWMSGASTAEPGEVDLLDDRRETEHDEHRETAALDTLAQRHRLPADAGKQIVGQNRVRTTGVRLLPARFLVEDGGRERGRVPARGLGPAILGCQPQGALMGFASSTGSNFSVSLS